MDPRAAYEAGRASAAADLAAEDGTIRVLSGARLAVAVAVLALIVGLVWGSFERWAAYSVGGLVLAFGVLVLLHARRFAAKARAEASVRFHARGLARLDGSWRKFPGAGAGYAPPEHPFADDLDIFGPASLFQLLDASETPFGRDALARLLSTASSGAIRPEGDASWQAAIVSRQEAVRELAPKLAWRRRLSVEGHVLGADAPDPAPFLAWAEGEVPLEVPGAVVWLARVLPLVVIAVGAAGQLHALPKYAWALVVLVEVAVAARYRDQTAATVGAVSDHAGSFARYGSLFEAALADSWQAPRLASAFHALRGGGDASAGVVQEMRRLERLVGFVEARNNEVFKLFLGPVLMWDLNFAVLLEAWRRRVGPAVRGWFVALGEIEAFASLAGFAHDRPDHAWPELRPEAQLMATGLGHPLIDGARRVGNDVSLPHAGTALVVTGSNMSGKSTLLRAIGVNTVLAQAGAPVAAKEMTLGEVTLATSMRIKDSLDEGVSHFYAELQRLKRVVEIAQRTPPVLFLLDEILHGTNSRERIIGARAVVLGLVRQGALGAVSTHDLGIAEMADVVPGAIRNVHFEEQVADDGVMTFDYRLRDGTVQSSNALRLMRAIGLDVPLDDPAVA